MDNKKYSERVVAFIDILGFSTLVNESKNDILKQNELHTILEKIMNVQRENEKFKKEIYIKYLDKEVTVFSDSIVI